MFKLPPSIIFVFISVVFTNCDNTYKSDSDSPTNNENNLSNYLQKIDDIQSIPIIGDYVVLEKTKDVIEEETKGKEDFVEKCARFLATRSIKIKLPGDEARGLLAESRKRKRIRKILLPLLLILKLKAAIILPIVLSLIAFVSFKGFGLSLAALAVAGTTALKNLFEHAAPKVSYEVVPAPIGPWSRAAVPEGSGSSGAQYEY